MAFGDFQNFVKYMVNTVIDKISFVESDNEASFAVSAPPSRAGSQVINEEKTDNNSIELTKFTNLEKITKEIYDTEKTFCEAANHFFEEIRVTADSGKKLIEQGQESDLSDYQKKCIELLDTVSEEQVKSLTTNPFEGKSDLNSVLETFGQDSFKKRLALISFITSISDDMDSKFKAQKVALQKLSKPKSKLQDNFGSIVSPLQQRVVKYGLFMKEIQKDIGNESEETNKIFQETNKIFQEANQLISNCAANQNFLIRYNGNISKGLDYIAVEEIKTKKISDLRLEIEELHNQLQDIEKNPSGLNSLESEAIRKKIAEKEQLCAEEENSFTVEMTYRKALKNDLLYPASFYNILGEPKTDKAFQAESFEDMMIKAKAYMMDRLNEEFKNKKPKDLKKVIRQIKDETLIMLRNLDDATYPNEKGLNAVEKKNRHKLIENAVSSIEEEALRLFEKPKPKSSSNLKSVAEGAVVGLAAVVLPTMGLTGVSFGLGVAGGLSVTASASAALSMIGGLVIGGAALLTPVGWGILGVAAAAVVISVIAKVIIDNKKSDAKELKANSLKKSPEKNEQQEQNENVILEKLHKQVSQHFCDFIREVGSESPDTLKIASLSGKYSTAVDKYKALIEKNGGSFGPVEVNDMLLNAIENSFDSKNPVILRIEKNADTIYDTLSKELGSANRVLHTLTVADDLVKNFLRGKSQDSKAQESLKTDRNFNGTITDEAAAKSVFQSSLLFCESANVQPDNTATSAPCA